MSLLKNMLIITTLFSLFACSSGEGGPETNPDGTPTTRFTKATDALPANVTNGRSMDAHTGDINNDGHLDIIVASESAQNLILINDGTGTFVDETSERLPQKNLKSEDLIYNDFDSDGFPDLLFVNKDNQENELYINNGEGLFSESTRRLLVTGDSNAVTAADVDGNLRIDIFIGNNGYNDLLMNYQSGFNLDAVRIPDDLDITHDLELGDVDNDGDLDLLVANENVNRLYINAGSGTFLDQTLARLPFRQTNEESREGDFADIDGDGDLDIFFANVTFLENGDPRNRILINNGSGFFTDESATRLPDDTFHTLDADFVDLDADGDLDLITANWNGAGLIAYMNNGSGVFTHDDGSIIPAGITQNMVDIEAGDFNGDGIIDLYIASYEAEDMILIGN